MMKCPSCNNELSQRGTHCPACGVLARCKSCQTVLELGANFCVGCGAAITGQQDNPISSGVSNGASMARTVNVIHFEEDMKSRQFHATVTDRAFEAGGDLLTAFLAGRLGAGHRRDLTAKLVKDSLSEKDEIPSDDEVRGDNGSATELDRRQQALPPSSEEAQLKEIFKVSGKELKLINSRLKQAKKKEFVERLTALFLYGHELLGGRESVSRDDVKEVLSKAKVYDGNARGWLTSTDLLSLDGDSISLSVPGRDFAKGVLKEYGNAAIETKWMLGSTRPTGRSSKGTSDDEISSDKTKGRKPKGTSYFAQIKKLVEDGTLKKGLTGDEVKAELEKRGHKFELRRINEALVRLTQSEHLSREKNSAGDWVYQSKK